MPVYATEPAGTFCLYWEISLEGKLGLILKHPKKSTNLTNKN